MQSNAFQQRMGLVDSSMVGLKVGSHRNFYGVFDNTSGHEGCFFCSLWVLLQKDKVRRCQKVVMILEEVFLMEVWIEKFLLAVLINLQKQSIFLTHLNFKLFHWNQKADFFKLFPTNNLLPKDKAISFNQKFALIKDTNKLFITTMPTT